MLTEKQNELLELARIRGFITYFDIYKVFVTRSHGKQVINFLLHKGYLVLREDDYGKFYYNAHL